MCEVLDRLEMRGRAEALAEGRAKARSKGYAERYAEGFAEGYAEGFAEGYAEGFAEGYAEGMNRILTLMQKLFAAGRVEDARKACFDRAYCNKLLIEFGLST